MITVKEISTNCNISSYKISRLVRIMGLEVLLREATRLQAKDFWDNKAIPPKSTIEMKFIKQAYLSMTQEYEQQEHL